MIGAAVVLVFLGVCVVLVAIGQALETKQEPKPRPKTETKQEPKPRPKTETKQEPKPRVRYANQRMKGRASVVGYSLRDRNNRRVYTGITNNPAARAAEHRLAGKKFATLMVETKPMFRGSAEAWERRSLASYKRVTGRLPKYNKTESGQYEKKL